MKKIHTLLLILAFNLILNFSYHAQSVVAIGSQSLNYIGQGGIIDESHNYILVGKLFQTNDYPHIAMFNSNFQPKWSFHLDKTASGAQKVMQTRDKKYLALFSSSLLLKFDSLGNIAWYHDFANVFQYSDVIEDASSNLYVVGYYMSKLLLTKLDVSGNVVWTYGYATNPASDNHFGGSIQETHDGNLLVSGIVSYLSATFAKVSLMKIDKNGNIIWSSIFACPDHNLVAGKFIEASDHSFFGVGYNGLGTTDTFDGFSLKIDSAGNYVNNKSIGFTYEDHFYDVCEAPGGGFVAVGMSKPTLNCGGNLFYTKFTQTNDTVFNKEYGTAAGNGAFFFNIKPAVGGGYNSFGSGSLWSTINLPYDYTFLHADAQLGLPCKQYGQAFNQSTLTITTTTAIVKSTFTPSFTSTFVKTDVPMHAVDACSGVPLGLKDHEIKANDFIIYPNPSSAIFTIASKSEKIKEIEVLNVLGENVYHFTPDNHQTMINLSGVAKGTYLLKITDSNNSISIRKIMIE